ncbi:MAG: MFS transporter [Nitrospirae bacterium]|nr:MFS transporter [Nitrospirota bacterium]
MPRDGRLLFATRSFRLFAYGFLSVILMIYLAQIGLSETQIGLLFTLTLIGDTIISLWVSTAADRVGRRRMLIFGSILMILAGVLFAATDNFVLLLVAATIGIISPSGYEVGPFLPIEQAALSHIVRNEQRTRIFSWYNLLGSFATALGALCGGGLTQALQDSGVKPLGSYRVIVIAYAVAGIILCFLFTRLSGTVEVSQPSPAHGPDQELKRLLGLHRSRRVVFKLSALFSLDAFAGGFVLQSIVAYWFHVRFNVQPALLGGIFFGANVLAGISALAAARIASRIGLVRTMVFTHIPSNILLILVPFMPTLPLAITMLLLRFSISQMDVPTRQSYIMAVVSPDERSAAAGLTGIARTTGSSLSPIITGPLLAQASLLNVPFFISGGLKIIYDLMLYRSFRALKPPEEKRRPGSDPRA